MPLPLTLTTIVLGGVAVLVGPIPVAVTAILIGGATVMATQNEELSHAKSVCDGMTQMKNICWKLSPAEMIDVLEASGYDCEEPKSTFEIAFSDRFICTDGRAEVRMSPDQSKVTFSCENFNACDHDFSEVGQSIVNSGIVPDLSFGFEPVFDIVRQENVDTPAFCGRGKNDEKVCVIENDANGYAKPLISFSRGSGGIKFE